MDRSESLLREEVSSFVASLQKLLPKKKDIVTPRFQKAKLTRLSDVHVEAKNVFPRCFVGARLVVLREVLDRVKLVQHYNYGKAKDTRHFAHLIHKEMETKKGDDGLLLDTSGAATATYTEHLDGYDLRLTSKIKDLVSSETEVTFEKETDKSVGSLTCFVKDVGPSTMKVVTQWMYRIFPGFTCGTEIGVRPLTYPLKAEFSVSARYEKPSYTLSSTISKSGFQVCLFKQFAPDLRISTILHEGERNSPTTLGIAMHKDYDNGSEVKIFVDSQRCGGFTFQKDVFFNDPQNEMRVVRLIWSTIIDRQRRVRFGFGFNLDF